MNLLPPKQKSNHTTSHSEPLALIMVCLLMVLGFSAFIWGESALRSWAALDVPQVISIQGKLTDENRITVPDSVLDMQFHIYDADSGGNCLWTASGSSNGTTCSDGTAISVTPKDGVFSILLGDTGQTVIPDDIFTSSDNRFIGVKIGSDAEMSPRIKLGAVPSAINAGLVGGFQPSQSAGESVLIATEADGDVFLIAATDDKAFFVNTSTYLSYNATGDLVFADAIAGSATLSDLLGGGGGTLDQAYDYGGAGAGRVITVDSGAIEMTGSNAGDYTLEVSNSANGGAFFVQNTGTGDSLVVFDQATDTTPFIIDASGNVGIGTASPNYPLTISSSTALGLRAAVTNGTPGNPSLDFYDSGRSVEGILTSTDKDSGGTNGFYIATYSNHPLLFGTNAATTRSTTGAWMTLDTSGQLGIGTTSPGQLLTVSKDQAAGTYAQVSNTNSSGIAGFMATSNLGPMVIQSIGSTEGATGLAGWGRLRTDSALNGFAFVTGGAKPITFNPNDSEAMRIIDGGSVGINTTGPDRRLDVLDASNPQLRLTYTDGSVYTDFRTSSGGELTITPSGG
ncbi:hypothetical protein KJ611_01680, partial [Patescibacteria group bacterium]|nr:hypothetical protein [Patescibacteria group bacterium]MBU1705466.1 hypothetical protein [Patescibacteria group bacterium]